MPSINARFNNWDNETFVITEFTIDPSLPHWDRFQYQLQQHVSIAVHDITRKAFMRKRRPTQDEWDTIPDYLTDLPFISNAGPGVVECDFGATKGQYLYVVGRGRYRTDLSVHDVAAGDQEGFELCYPN